VDLLPDAARPIRIDRRYFRAPIDPVLEQASPPRNGVRTGSCDRDARADYEHGMTALHLITQVVFDARRRIGAVNSPRVLQRSSLPGAVFAAARETFRNKEILTLWLLALKPPAPS
jgi:hypothetical protein